MIHLVEVALESIHVRGPEPTERSQPRIELLKWLRFQPVEMALLGWYKETFSIIAGGPVEVELVDSVLRGGKHCSFLIKLAH